MWIKVLPADSTKEAYFTEVSNDLSQAWLQINRLIHGMPEVVKTQALIKTFGYSIETGQPNVVMIINESGQVSKMPINAKASKYYPNEYDVKIRGDAVLTGWRFQINSPEDMGFDIWTMPPKWKVIHDMETVLASGGEDYEMIHAAFDDLLLSVADPDVAKMYREAQAQIAWHMS